MRLTANYMYLLANEENGKGKITIIETFICHMRSLRKLNTVWKLKVLRQINFIKIVAEATWKQYFRFYTLSWNTFIGILSNLMLLILGELYTWGCGEYGRLGHSDNVTQLRPKQVKALAGQRVIQVACGSRDAQTLALTDEGLVYSWGEFLLWKNYKNTVCLKFSNFFNIQI